MQAGIAASVPDRVPVSQRGAVSAWLGVPQCIGVVLAALLVATVATGSSGYLALAVLTVALALPFALGTREEALPAARRPPVRWGSFLQAFDRSPDFCWAWLTRFLIVTGESAAVQYLLYFLRDRVHYSSLFPGQTPEDGLVIGLLRSLLPRSWHRRAGIGHGYPRPFGPLTRHRQENRIYEHPCGLVWPTVPG
jgi:hypothetical protein